MRKRIKDWFGKLKDAGRVLFASVAVQVDDSAGWQPLAGDGPSDRPWHEQLEDLQDALEAWRKNFLIRQIVRLTTAFVVGDGMVVSSAHRWIAPFVSSLWEHEQNKVAARLPGLCDELTRSGELFIALFTNPVDGMSYIREVPASVVQRVLTAENDYERELGYEEVGKGQLEPKVWKSKHTVKVGENSAGLKTIEPVLLHYKVNRVVGATRGESDLSPVLPWAKRYVAWLKGRVRFNDLRSKLSTVDIEVPEKDVAAKRNQYRTNPPINGALFVHGPGEKISFPAANIQAWDAEPDGRALRLASAAGANIPLHFLAEGSSATRSTAAEMGDPTRRHYRMRQLDIKAILFDIVTQAYKRKVLLGLARMPAGGDLGLMVEATDVSREDNEALAGAAKTVVDAFNTMKTNGWIDDETAIRLSFKFAGEVLSEEKILEIMEGESNGEEEETESGAGEEELTGYDSYHVNGNGQARRVQSSLN